MTREQQADEWCLAHRELQELRALARVHGGRMSKAERSSRRRYASQRQRKTDAARKRAARWQ